ncbi:hypothetical protein PP655_gp080 [Bacillus phage PBC4]|uniref:Uncharacterized protein n=1 Tax=Bacillus phage PBC4 TaxID=1675028 RepID=A0A1D6X8A7_9CAUD|nr:hypothetical protein PP655_gp080 [Bacillus phage PBC4]AKQ08272.1 hypothetical protein PBC4_080 [Bacillus phage PBC4]
MNWYEKMSSIGKDDAKWIYENDVHHMRYRMELEDYLLLECDPYEEKVFRFLFRKSFSNPHRGDSLFYTIDFKRLSELLHISEAKLRKSVIPSLEEKGLIERHKENKKRPYTYIIKSSAVRDTVQNST